MSHKVRRRIESLFKATGENKDFADERGITRELQKELDKLQKEWEKGYGKLAEINVERLFRRVMRNSGISVNGCLRKMELPEIDTKVITQPMQEIYKASVDQSVELIKSIPEQYFGRIKGDVMRTITTPSSSLSQLTKNIQRYGAMGYKRANNIALDQTRKAYQSFNCQYLREAGVSKAIWVHTGGTLHPREKHKKFDGKTFDLTKGAPVGPNDEFVLPAQEPFCRCTFIPIIGQ